jgi:hypothetical protein
MKMSIFEMKRGLFGIVMIALIALFGSSANAVLLVGNPFTPAGANFQIIGLQGINSSNPLGATGFEPQVNNNFEFTPSIGVSYDQGGGKLKDFGLGLYSDSSKQTVSTGLQIQYNSMVNASSVSIVVEDFDIDSGKSAFFKTGKVEPGIILLGANNSIVATFSPTDVFGSMKAKNGAKDIWDINFSDLLTALNKPDVPISGFVLFADANNGEKANSDPYLLVSVGNGIVVVPEATNYVAGAFAIGLILLTLGRARSRKAAAA